LLVGVAARRGSRDRCADSAPVPLLREQSEMNGDDFGILAEVETEAMADAKA
jgi:hypothetical protein